MIVVAVLLLVLLYLLRRLAGAAKALEVLSRQLDDAHDFGAALASDRGVAVAERDGARMVADAYSCRIDDLGREREAMQQQIDLALGPHCTSCGNPIDPDCCWCGTAGESHLGIDDHGFIPMGCDCGRYERDWKQIAKARGVLLWRTLAERDEARAATPYAMVREFHAKFCQPDSPVPDVSQHRALRLSLISEESKELRDALEANDVIAVADALADLQYVVIGSALQWGIPLDRVFAEVHRSNMTKEGGGTRADGKVLKGPNYSPPDVAGVIGVSK